ncbi:MAG: hypothetical protein HIU92_17405 [Proteobacteria bacterium]|nr:hypothetical protein [Pseudomonadota bacterium]
MSDAIFILGYYRSGTSALSGTLQRLGITLHNDADANEHNPLGFYEIPELIEFDVDLFNRLGVEWQDVRNLEDKWWDRADMAGFLSRLCEILHRRFAAEPLWGIKHPHLCRLFPLYARAAQQADHTVRVIHICRDPWTVAASQHKKNGLSRAHALLLWASYLTAAERHARGHPRSWITYHDLLTKPAAQIRRLEEQLGIDLTHRLPNGLREATSFLTSQLDRSKPLPAKDLLAPLHRLVNAMWEAILAQDFAPDRWDGFAEGAKELVGFVEELGSSRGSVLPWLMTVTRVPAQAEAEQQDGRPAERADEGARARLNILAGDAGPLPRVAVLIAAPPNRAHAINDSLESLRAQWHAPHSIRIIASDAIDLPGQTVIATSGEAGALTRTLCAEVSAAAADADYVAVLNAGDTVARDACLRFALEARATAADLIYCDEVVPHDGGHWVRYKPAWDLTRLRQVPFPGDWVWYRADTLLRLGGLNPEMAGAEEYDYQLRLAETAPRVVRLAETLFTRTPLARRDNIPSTVFISRAADAISAHLDRCGMPAAVEPRQHLGLYRHVRTTEDPGTTTILLCDGAEIGTIDASLRDLLTHSVLTGPIILAAAELAPETAAYFSRIIEKVEALEHKVIAFLPVAGAGTDSRETGDALRQALARVTTPLVAILDARAQTATPDWQSILRQRLADRRVAMSGARTLTPLPDDKSRFAVQGPIVIGADARMGASHFADDPGPGGWLAVDQEASAIAPPGLLARHAALAACVMPSLSGDALWIDLGAQLRAGGHTLVWTPDAAFVMPAQAMQPDVEGLFRGGSDVARGMTWDDPYHHPAFSLRGDLLAPERRPGLVRSSPPDPRSLLLTGPPDAAVAMLNAARGLRACGVIQATWAPDGATAAEIARRAPSSWIRLNPETAAPAQAPPYAAILSRRPTQESKPILAAASQVYATSPELVVETRRHLPPGRHVELWRPALSRPIWEALSIGAGINSRPRILWIDEGIEPPWLPDLINETMVDALWVVVERPHGTYQGSVTRIRPPGTEQRWAAELAAVAPHILVRPADRSTEADHYKALMAAAVGCHLLVDERLDMPEALGAIRLPNRIAAWQRAVKQALANFPSTLASGARTRAACLALPAVEAAPPAWAAIPSDDIGRGQASAPRAAE